MQIVARTGLLTVFFSATPVTDYAGARACDHDAYAAWCRGLLARGVYAPASQYEAWFPSLAHTPEHIERTVAAAAAAFAEIGRMSRRRTPSRACGRRSRDRRRPAGRRRRRRAGRLRDRGDAGLDPVALAASGPRAARHRDDVELAVTAVLEGCLLHYGKPRALQIDDPDLALLAGDRLYALGLERLASIGDLGAIAELADIIALSAQAHASGDERARARRLARRRRGDRLGRGRADRVGKGARARGRSGRGDGAACVRRRAAAD